MNTRLKQYLSSGQVYLADGGLETSLIFHDGVDLPCFASFTELSSLEGRQRLAGYYQQNIAVAANHGTGFLLDTVTWRANMGWAAELGLGEKEIRSVNAEAVKFARALREQNRSEPVPILINGVVGPSGDGYAIEDALSVAGARTLHSLQIETIAATGVDLITALTMTYFEEALGITQAARNAGVPIAISFTVETDGNLPSGQSLGEAITELDRETGNEPLYYMINCAHPDHFEDAISNDEPWLQRIGGIRANASRMSHAELDEAEELDDGCPDELAGDYRRLLRALPQLKVMGGCCGTDHRHISAFGHLCRHNVAEQEQA